MLQTANLFELLPEGFEGGVQTDSGIFRQTACRGGAASRRWAAITRFGVTVEKGFCPAAAAFGVSQAERFE